MSRRAVRWPGFRSVLCGVDFSEESRRALRHADVVARHGGGALKVIYANDPLLVSAAAAALHDRGVARRSAAELKTFIAGTLNGAGTPRHVTARAAVGRASDVLLEAASHGRSDLIVVGTQGLTGAERLVLGSTALRILQQAAVPVLVVPPAGTPGEGIAASWPGAEIVAAIELDADGSREVRHAARIAEWFGASLLLLNVVEPLPVPRWLKGDLAALERRRLALARRQIDRLADLVRNRMATTTHVMQGRIADQIAAFASLERAGLIVTALRDRAGWFGTARGSISYHVLSRAAVPVLAYPPRWRPR
ncbi:MAG: universal stress protein [Acidobacteria bacterium]|nr:universal stress protein [Acidobacteriota bacterium]